LLVDVLGFELAWPEPQRYESLWRRRRSYRISVRDPRNE
jgi:hypothetical protein